MNRRSFARRFVAGLVGGLAFMLGLRRRGPDQGAQAFALDGRGFADDGLPITGAAMFGGELLIFKKDSVSVLVDPRCPPGMMYSFPRTGVSEWSRA